MSPQRPSTLFEPDQAAFISFIGVFFPPAAVAIVKGWHKIVALNFALWILGVFPGMIHAFWVVAKHTRPSSLGEPLPPHDIESGNFPDERQRLLIRSPSLGPWAGPINHHAQTRPQAPAPGPEGVVPPSLQETIYYSPATTPLVRSSDKTASDAGVEELENEVPQYPSWPAEDRKAASA